MSEPIAGMRSRRVSKVETFIVTLPRDTPYLGPLGPGETVNERGYIVRRLHCCKQTRRTDSCAPGLYRFRGPVGC